MMLKTHTTLTVAISFANCHRFAFNRNHGSRTMIANLTSHPGGRDPGNGRFYLLPIIVESVALVLPV
eukprot:scaffold3929_cov141-Skeletonema_menzelii.AAC.2